MPDPGPRPEGSPEAMKRKAGELKRDAVSLRAKFEGLPAIANSVEFQANAGQRFRKEVNECARNAGTYAGQAEELARTLIKEANRLEERQDAWRIRFDEHIYELHPEKRPPRPPGGGAYA